VDVAAQEIVQLHDINLSFAAQSPRGLVVPVVHGAGEMTTAELAQLGLTFDHRVCDGATAGGFLRFVADCVEKPACLLAFL
jgi:2-oxoisovalerate dehydrogenase E2 component (dihydrolipoyl transacylase)